MKLLKAFKIAFFGLPHGVFFFATIIFALAGTQLPQTKENFQYIALSIIMTYLSLSTYTILATITLELFKQNE